MWIFLNAYLAEWIFLYSIISSLLLLEDSEGLKLAFKNFSFVIHKAAFFSLIVFGIFGLSLLKPRPLLLSWFSHIDRKIAKVYNKHFWMIMPLFFMYVYTYVWIYVVYVWMCLSMYVCLYVMCSYIFVHFSLYVCICVYVFCKSVMYTYLNIYTYVIYAYMCLCVCTRFYVLICESVFMGKRQQHKLFLIWLWLGISPSEWLAYHQVNGCFFLKDIEEGLET